MQRLELADIALGLKKPEPFTMHVTAVLAKAMSQQVGGTQIGGFMNTALANNQW